MNNLKIKFRAETRTQIEALAACWGVSFTEAFAKVLRAVSPLISRMTDEQLRAYNSRTWKGFAAQIASAARPGWMDVDLAALPREYSSVKNRIRAAFPELRTYGPYSCVVWRVAVRAFLSSNNGNALPPAIGGTICLADGPYSFGSSSMPVVVSECL